MKRNIYIYALCAMSLVGCGDDFLTPKPHSFFTPETVLTDLSGLESMLVSCHSITRNQYFGHAAPIMAEFVFSDIANKGGADANIPVDLVATITPDAEDGLNKDVQIRPYWENWYKIIGRTNMVIDRLENVETDDEAARNRIRGQAYFYRAYAYYHLVHQFGDVPLTLEETASPRLDYFTYSKESILAKMRDDLKEAVTWLPDVTELSTPGKAAANHLLTKIHLALGEFDEAIAAADAVINDGRHSLMTTRFGEFKNKEFETEGFRAYTNGGEVALDVIYDLHCAENKSAADNREAIFNVIDRGGFEGLGDSDIQTMRNCTPFWNFGSLMTPDGQNGLQRTFDDFGQYRLVGRGLGNLRMSNWLAYEIWDDPNDLRHKQPNWWRMEDLVYNHQDLKASGNQYYGKHVTTYINNADSIRCWSPFFNKFLIADERNDPNGHHSDWYVFRVTETYLLKAEAYYWKGDLSSAAQSLNAVRERANCAPLPDSRATIDAILDERAKELYWEEPRKSELARIAWLFAKTGKVYEGNGKTYSTGNFSEDNFFYDRVIAKNNFYRENIPNKMGVRYRIAPFHVYWPVPYEVRDANLLGYINQNRGYAGSENNIAPKNYPEDYYVEE